VGGRQIAAAPEPASWDVALVLRERALGWESDDKGLAALRRDTVPVLSPPDLHRVAYGLVLRGRD